MQIQLSYNYIFIIFFMTTGPLINIGPETGLWFLGCDWPASIWGCGLKVAVRLAD